MEQRKKQILLEKLTEYNETVNNMSKFKLNAREENLFCDIMQQFAEEYHTAQLSQYNVSGRSEQLPNSCECDNVETFNGWGNEKCIRCIDCGRVW